MSLILDVATGGVRGGTSILYAGVGEAVSERAGVINLGVEGSMLAGALAGYMIAAETGNPWLGVAVAAVAGGVMSLAHAILVVIRGANQFASGLAVLFLALGLTSLFGAPYVGRSITSFEVWEIPGLSSIPVLGPVLFSHDPLVYLSFVAIPAVWFVLYRTRAGLILRTAGERADSLTVHGYNVQRVRMIAVTIGGIFAGIGGAHVSIAYTNSWFENMIAGRGFIAVALVIFASWSPLKVFGGAYLFGAALALGPALQARGVGVNQFALHVVPFTLTIIVLAALGRRTISTAPAELKKVFENAPPDP